MKRFFAALAILPIAACSTAIEEAASDAYAPVFPTMAEYTPTIMPTGGIYNAGAEGFFAMDRRAANVGDILTVELVERFAATKAQAASSSRSDQFSVNLPGIIGAVTDSDLTSGGDTSFAGNGAASQSNSLSGRMSVTVVRILPGGNLEIMGQKKLTLNNGDEYIRLYGVVRQADISSDNVIRSDRIAHAEIKYIGAGQVADAGKRGWLSSALNSVSPY